MCSKKCSEIGNLTKLFIYVRLSLYNPKDDEDGALCPPPTQSARGKRERERDKNARNPALLGNLFDFSGFYYPFIDEERPGEDDCFTGGIQNCRDVIIAYTVQCTCILAAWTNQLYRHHSKMSSS
jgi:hypothetical protein